MEENQAVSGQNLKSLSSKKKFYLIIFAFLIIATIFGVRYVASEIKFRKARQTNPNQLSNIESQIYDLKSTIESEFSKSDGDIEPVDENELQKGFTYSGIVKQQLQIEDLSKKYEFLKIEMDRIKSQDKLSKLVLAFVELKDRVETNQNYEENLQKLEVLASGDSALSTKINKLKLILKETPKSKKEIKDLFESLIPEIMAKKSDLFGQQDFFSKVKRNIAKLIVIRRVDGIVTKTSENVDFIIFETEKLIDKERYGEALELLSALGESYHPILAKLILDLQNADQFNKTSEEIFSYLKGLSRN